MFTVNDMMRGEEMVSMAAEAPTQSDIPAQAQSEVPTQSEEFEISQEISALIGKVLSNTASDTDLDRLAVLNNRREQLMRPASLRRLQEFFRKTG